jgi:hypothetical protein
MVGSVATPEPREPKGGNSLAGPGKSWNLRGGRLTGAAELRTPPLPVPSYQARRQQGKKDAFDL